MIQFDPTLRLGDVGLLIGYIAGGFVAYYKLKEKITASHFKHEAANERLDRIEAQIEDAKHDLKNSQAQDLHLAQHRSEINRIWDLLEDLRHWRGFVNPDGEYMRNKQPPNTK